MSNVRPLISQGRKMRTPLMLSALVLVPSACFSLDTQRALDNLAEDVSACVAYYTVVAVDARRNAEQGDLRWREIGVKYEAASARAIGLLRQTMGGKPESFLQSKLDLRMQGALKVLESDGIDRLT